jgi:hypothetical protein
MLDWRSTCDARDGSSRHPEQCLLCDLEKETVQHILAFYVFTRKLWHSMFSPLINLQQLVETGKQKSQQRTKKRTLTHSLFLELGCYGSNGARMSLRECHLSVSTTLRETWRWNLIYGHLRASKLLCPRGSITNVSTTPINLKTEPHLWTLALQELQTLQGLDLGRIEL